MRKHQTGEVILAMMVVMLVVMWLGSGHISMMGMGKMEEDAAHAEKSGSAKQKTKSDTAPSTMPKESTESQNLK